MTTISPVQTQNSNGITGKDVAITAGGATLGALGTGIPMYLRTPSEDAFIKAGIAFDKKELSKEIKICTKVLKDLTSDSKVLSEDTKSALLSLGTSEKDIANLTIDNVKTDLKEICENISDKKLFESAKESFNSILPGAIDTNVKMADKTDLTDILKNMYQDAKENLKSAGDTLDKADKAGLEILKKAKMSAALKWGGLAAGVAALITAGCLYLAKENNTTSEQPTQTEQA